MIKNLLDKKNNCPCGSGYNYKKCCKPYHDGSPAPTAEALMRARYSAYKLAQEEYLFHTWHPGSRPKQISLGTEHTVDWTRLEIIRTEEGGANDKKGVVEFKAFYAVDGKTGYLHETSHFVKEDNQWYYFDGDIEYHDDDEQDDFKNFKPTRRLSVET